MIPAYRIPTHTHAHICVCAGCQRHIAVERLGWCGRDRSVLGAGESYRWLGEVPDFNFLLCVM